MNNIIMWADHALDLPVEDLMSFQD